MIVRILVSAVLLFSTTQAARAESLRLEAELVPSAHRYNAGGGPVGEALCGSASNNLVMGGLDADGDYIEFELNLVAPFCFSDSLRADAQAGVPWRYRLVILPAAGGDPLSDELYPEAIGHGIVCPVRFEWVRTQVTHCLQAGTYWLRIIRVGSGETRVDCLDLRELPVPASEISWSRVKALFE